ncbi:hypothetical protein GY45DRAFT_1366973 [Cubamyces sp. BRFM 1775]|nr:hypothetical protein GY45DRAFT_1366973 [Cubamyces sp. BRFM 1775]
MFKVLDHPHGATSSSLYTDVSVIPRLLLSLVFYSFAIAASGILAVAAQDVVNGQVLTQGFSVLDSPQPNFVLNAGSSSEVAIQVPSLTNATFGLDSLEVYLVSSDPQMNITISSGPQALTQEPGSDVKHIRWNVPTCLQSGSYNLTLYEASHFNDASFFAITPIPVQVRNSGNVSSSCDLPVNPLQSQPQPSNPPPSNLTRGYASGGTPSTATTTSSAPGSVLTPPPGGGIITVTAGDGDITIGISDLPGTIVVEPSGGAPSETTTTDAAGGVTTVFETIAPTATATFTQIVSQPVTITFEETYVSTLTAPGTTLEFTVTQTVLSTTELVSTQVSSPEQAGLLPVNSASRTMLSTSLLLHWTLLAVALAYALL